MTESTFSPERAQNVVEEFSTRFTKQAGMIYTAKDPEDSASIVNGLIKSRGRGESCCSPDIRSSKDDSQTDISQLINATTAYQDFQRNPRSVAGLLDIGITKAAYGVAETGSIVDVSYTDEHRLLSSISRIHIAILESSCILAKLSMLSSTLRDLLKSGFEPKPSVTFIGGPSRTSDIELKSVLGVHGPHEVHVVLL